MGITTEYWIKAVQKNVHIRKGYAGAQESRNIAVKAGACSFLLELPSEHTGCAPAGNIMAFFQQSITVLQTLVIALGAGLGVWGGINLLEGYGNDNPGAKSQGIKQLMAGGGVALIGTTLIPVLGTLFG